MAREAGLAVGRRVRVYPGSSDERLGVIVEDFGDSSGSAVMVGTTRVAGPSRRWAITLDDGGLVFADSVDIADAHDTL